MPDAIRIELEGMDELLEAFDRFPTQIARNFSQAGHEAGNMILREQGLQNYPPATAANRPPTPYYVRGRGMQTSPGHNTGSSERLGSQWTIKRMGPTTIIGNRASYAEYVHGEGQASFMEPKGWRILKEVAEEKKDQITQVFQKWVNYTIRQLGL